MNTIEKGVVGTDGNTLVTSYAWVDIEIDGVKITNIPLKNSEYDSLDDNSKHDMHMSGYNCYIKSFSCERSIPNAVQKFWTDAGGSLKCNLVVYDPSFIQFENLIMQSVKNQKVHCKISYGISSTQTGNTPKPFEAHCFIKSMSENVTATGAEWDLTLNTVPPEYFDVYKVKNSKKETVYNLGKGTEYKRVSDLVVELLEEEGWNGIVIETEELKKNFKIPTKDYASRIDLIRLKLAPMAKCSDSNRKDLYHILISLDNSVYFMPSNMTIKEALESKIAKKVGNLNVQDSIENEINIKSTIEQLNMNDYILEENGALVFKYGFKNSLVQSLSINYDCKSMITQFFYDFSFTNENGEIENFRFPNFDDSLMNDKNACACNKKIYLYETNKEDALEMARTIVRKLHVETYKGSATLINWPYVSPCQKIRFEYLIPNGSAIAMKQHNEVGKKESVTNVSNPENLKKVDTVNSYNKAEIINKNNKDRNENNSVVADKKQMNQIFSDNIFNENDKSLLTAKGFLKGNRANSDIKKDADFRANVGIPATLTEWSDTHKQSTTYYVESIKDTIEGGIMITELTLTSPLRDNFPQLNSSL